MTLSALSEILTPDVLEKMSDEELTDLYSKIKAYQDYQRFNRIEYFSPYPYQRDFMDAGKDFNIRYLRAGNRTGKTYSAAAEFSYHITGRYPDWWTGAKIEGAGHTFWAVGITLESAANVIQKELFGTADIRTEDIGTGTIPKVCIERNQGWTPDGGKIKSCMIRHQSGGLNTLRFFGSENVAVMMGAKCALIWMDEEALNGTEVYTQCVTRLINALGPGKNGHLMLTATPERGNTDLNRTFDNPENSHVLYIKSASWDDCPHFTPEMIKNELAKYPSWQHEMRRRGLPVLGSGAVFEFSDEQISLPEVLPGNDWQIVGGIDWGVNVDATVVAFVLHNTSTDFYYLYDLFYFDKDEYERSPAHVAEVILNSPYSNVPIIRPHDHPALSNQLRNYGCNVPYKPFQNPPQSELKIRSGNSGAYTAQSVDTGLDEMRYLLSEGRLKILQRCFKWFEEKRLYQYVINKNTGKMSIGKTPDHAIDASRYAVLSAMMGRGCRWDEASTISANSFDSAIELNF
ncbi:terminase family protein [Salmonella enterica]|nr:terminase family protein [Salmonella enterica]